MAKRKYRHKKKQILRHRIKRTPLEKLALVLWTALCTFLVSVFFFMTWYMYNPASRLAHNLKYGNRYLAAADYPKAVSEFRRVLSMDEGNTEAYRGLMEAAIASEDTDTAISLYGSAGPALESYKEPLLRLLELRAVARMEEEDYDGAFSVAVTVEKATGDANEASLIRALVIDGMLDHASRKPVKEALALYRRLLTIDNVDRGAVYELIAKLYIREGDPDTALEVIDEGIRDIGEDERLTALRGEYTVEYQEVFLPDSFIKELNDAMAAVDFEKAAEVVRHELFLTRIAEFAGAPDANGERTYDFTPIQPADMNTTMYGEFNEKGRMIMLIIDWERQTPKEAAFNELAYVPSTGEILALTQKQRVTESNTLADEGHYYRVGTEGLTEIDGDSYITELTAVFENADALGDAGDAGVSPAPGPSGDAGAADDGVRAPGGTTDPAGLQQDFPDDGAEQEDIVVTQYPEEGPGGNPDPGRNNNNNMGGIV